MDLFELTYQLSKQPEWLVTTLVFGAGVSLGLIFAIRLR